MEKLELFVRLAGLLEAQQEVFMGYWLQIWEDSIIKNSSWFFMIVNLFVFQFFFSFLMDEHCFR